MDNLVIMTQKLSSKNETTSFENDRFLDSVLRCASEIYSSEGLAGFFVGLKPRLLIVSIGGMFYFFAAVFVDSYLDLSYK